jgi:arylsulfatase
VPGNKYFDPVINHNGQFVKTQGFCTDVFFRQASGWINEQRKGPNPFFAYISLNAAHSPFIAPKRYTDRFLKQGMSKQLAGFYGMIENIDDNVGAFIKHLEAWGLEENTLVIFMTDNGSTVDFIVNNSPEQTRFVYKAGMAGHKARPDEGGSRVPCFLRWKGKLPEGVDVDRLTAHIDLLPTLAEIADAKLPPDGQVEGRSIVPLLHDPDALWKDRYIFIHCGRWKRGGDPDQAKYVDAAIRNERFRLINNKELYDIQADLGQKHNVIEQFPDLVCDMRTAYDEWWNEVRPMMVNENAVHEGGHPYINRYRQQKKQSVRIFKL